MGLQVRELAGRVIPAGATIDVRVGCYTTSCKLVSVRHGHMRGGIPCFVISARDGSPKGTVHTFSSEYGTEPVRIKAVTNG